MNVHATISPPPKLPPSPRSLAASIAVADEGTPIFRLAQAAETINKAAGEVDRITMSTGAGRCYVHPTIAAESHVMEAMLCSKPKSLQDIVLPMLAGCARMEAVHGEIDNNERAATANAIMLAMESTVAFLAPNIGQGLADDLGGWFGEMIRDLPHDSPPPPESGSVRRAFAKALRDFCKAEKAVEPIPGKPRTDEETTALVAAQQDAEEALLWTRPATLEDLASKVEIFCTNLRSADELREHFLADVRHLQGVIPASKEQAHA